MNRVGVQPDTQTMDRLVVAATLKPGTRARAAELVAEGSPFDPSGSGLTSHGVYLSEREIVFAFEGPQAEFLVRAMINDPVRAAGFDAWAPLIEGFPRLVRESWHWSRAADEAATSS
jgi:hypothetical protein